MILMTKVCLVFLAIGLVGCGVTVGQEDLSMFEEDIGRLGYPYEVHTVVTEDGYTLTAFRIQAKRSRLEQEGLANDKPIVLLAHGLDEIADIYILNDEDKALALVLANKGYDVWLLNNRGTCHSREHSSFSLHNSAMWDFSFQEMA